MFLTRRRRPLLIAGSILIGLAALVVTAEVVVRAQVDAAVASRTDAIAGVSVSRSGASALWAFALGRVEVRASVTDAALESMVACRTDQPVTLAITPGSIDVETELALRGRTLPVRVAFVPRETIDGWSFIADSIAVAGLSLPSTRVGPLLGDGAPDWLQDGVALPSPHGSSVTKILLEDGVASFFADLPLSADMRVPADVLSSPACDQ